MNTPAPPPPEPVRNDRDYRFRSIRPERDLREALAIIERMRARRGRP